MRSLFALGAASLALPLPGHAINMFDWLSVNRLSTLSSSLSSDVLPLPQKQKIAVIGAGAGGSSAAFWAAKAGARAGVNVELDVYEKNDYIGGRSTTIFPYNDHSLDPCELGASIFIKENKVLWRAAEAFNLSRRSFEDIDLKKKSFEDVDKSTGFWNGEKFVFTMNQGTGIFEWVDTIKVLLRYGIAPYKANSIVKDLISKFVTLYDPSTPSWTNITDLVTALDWEDLLTQTAAHYYDSQGVSQKFSREIIEAATRVNYGQNLDVIHALEGTVSMAATGASSIKGGNFQIFEQFLSRSGANIYLNTTVTSLSEKADHWVLKTSNGESKHYTDIILAAPYHQTGIKVSLSSGLLSLSSGPEVPEQPYVHLHVTLLTTTAPHPNPEYFGLKPGAKAPTSILTTYEGARKGGAVPEFNSMTYHGKVSSDREEWVVKIFSKEMISDEWLHKVFSGKVGWVHRKEWDAYPELPPTSTFPPMILAPGLYYVNSFEPLVSTMETETISSRNIVDQLFQNRFGVDICGKALPAAAEQPEPAIVLEGEVHQLVMAESVVGEIKAETEPTKPVVVAEDFVYGWDCA